MANFTKKLQFTKHVQRVIVERDNYQCLFCRMKYHMPKEWRSDLAIFDIMHFINKSDLGLGIEENGVLGCRYHHHMLDNGNDGHREEMLDIMRGYLESSYPEWEEKKLRYRK